MTLGTGRRVLFQALTSRREARQWNFGYDHKRLKCFLGLANLKRSIEAIVSFRGHLSLAYTRA